MNRRLLRRRRRRRRHRRRRRRHRRRRRRRPPYFLPRIEGSVEDGKGDPHPRQCLRFEVKSKGFIWEVCISTRVETHTSHMKTLLFTSI